LAHRGVFPDEESPQLHIQKAPVGAE